MSEIEKENQRVKKAEELEKTAWLEWKAARGKLQRAWHELRVARKAQKKGEAPK